MAQESCWTIYQALIWVAGHPCNGEFIRQQSLTADAVQRATELIKYALPPYYDSPNGKEYLAPLPSLDNHLASRRKPTATEMDDIVMTHFWLEAAFLLRQAQDHMRRPEFGYYMTQSIPVERMMILQTFQHYILVCLGRGQIADPWLQLDDDHVDTNVPDLNRIRKEWEKPRLEGWDYLDIILYDSFWLSRSLGVEITSTRGQHMRWKVAVSYQRSLLVL